MIGLIKLNLLKLNLGKLDPRGLKSGQRQQRTSLLAMALDGNRLEAMVVRRTNGSVRVQNPVAASLELNLLTGDPELVGREIRNHLDRAGVRERQCTVCIPLDWALTLHIPVPDLPPEDIDSFLNIEAERGFPFPQETLSVTISRCRAANGVQFATLIAIPKDHLTTLQKVLKAAQLKPLTFSLGLPALEDPAKSTTEGTATVAIRENSVELQIVAGGGIAALRTLQGALEQDGLRRNPYADVVARDLRITLGQLPAELRETVHHLKVFGSGSELGRFAEELGARAKGMGLAVEVVKGYSRDDHGVDVPLEASVSPALSLAIRILTGRGAGLEFLPPKISAWQQVTARYSSGKLMWTGVGVGAVIALIGIAFLIQQWQLGHWRNRWKSIRPRVTELDTMQQQIRRFRPWFDDSFRSLSILRKLTEAFPEDGAVSANRVEIRDPGIVTCTGTVKDQQALLKVVAQLRASKEIANAQVDNIRGKQFTISLRWIGGGAP